MRRALTALAGVVIGGAFYLLLIDTVSLPELYAGAGATLLAGIAYEISREQGFAEASISPAWFARGWRVVVRVPVHVALVSREALAQLFTLRQRRGVFRAVPFEAGGDGSRAAGRRAITEALGSLAPNTIVIGIDPDRNLLLVHQLYKQGDREELDPMGLG
jgi:multisubunit Na+/H+ antiporter MnhE subunit